MKNCLIVVDYQVDFVNGALGFAGAELLESRIAAKIERARANGAEVLFTLDTHGEDYLDTREGKDIPLPHCIEHTSGHELYGKIAQAVQQQDRLFCKETFGSRTLFTYLFEQSFDAIELVGLVSNICVLSNAVLAKAACPNADISVDASCTDSFDKALHESALQVLEGLHIRVTGR